MLDHLHQIAVHSSDLDRSIAFYRDQLGLTFVGRFDPPGLAFFRIGPTRLLLERNAPPATIYFRVADIDAAAETLRARGINLLGDPQLVHRDERGQFGTAGAEEWMAFFRDPDENLLAIAAQRMPARGG